jgi:hypothetical protein
LPGGGQAFDIRLKVAGFYEDLQFHKSQILMAENTPSNMPVMGIKNIAVGTTLCNIIVPGFWFVRKIGRYAPGRSNLTLQIAA